MRGRRISKKKAKRVNPDVILACFRIALKVLELLQKDGWFN
ncbi:hypothetical protein [Alloactinosynnema sp. L-07]|nr:hypothetical protein [Alloactinosynnema sp. L-07]